MKNIGFYISFQENEIKFLESILPKLEEKGYDFAVYSDIEASAQSYSVPFFHSADLINFDGSIVVFNFKSLRDILCISNMTKKIFYIFSSDEEGLGIIDILKNKSKIVLLCKNEECLNKAERIFGENLEKILISEQIIDVL